MSYLIGQSGSLAVPFSSGSLVNAFSLGLPYWFCAAWPLPLSKPTWSQELGARVWELGVSEGLQKAGPCLGNGTQSVTSLLCKAFSFRSHL